MPPSTAVITTMLFVEKYARCLSVCLVPAQFAIVCFWLAFHTNSRRPFSVLSGVNASRGEVLMSAFPWVCPVAGLKNQRWRRGMVPTMLGILPYAGLDIAAFEIMHDRLRGAYGDPAAVPPAALLVAGMLSSTGAQLVAYPLGFVRTRLQARPLASAPLPQQPMLSPDVAGGGWARGLFFAGTDIRR